MHHENRDFGGFLSGLRSIGEGIAKTAAGIATGNPLAALDGVGHTLSGIEDAAGKADKSARSAPSAPPNAPPANPQSTVQWQGRTITVAELQNLAAALANQNAAVGNAVRQLRSALSKSQAETKAIASQKISPVVAGGGGFLAGFAAGYFFARKGK